MVILVPPAFGPRAGSREWTTGSWREGKGSGSSCRLMGSELDGGWWSPTYHIGEVLPRPALLGGVHNHHV